MKEFMHATFVAALRSTFEHSPGWKREIAALAGITEKQVNNWLNKGSIPRFSKLVNLLRNSDEMKMWWVMMTGVSFAADRLNITCAEALTFCAQYPGAVMASHNRKTNEEAWRIIDSLYAEFRNRQE